MNSLTDLREVVDVVIGVDTHGHTHTAAVVDAATGGVLDEVTVEATAQGYDELVEFANTHETLHLGVTTAGVSETPQCTGGAAGYCSVKRTDGLSVQVDTTQFAPGKACASNVRGCRCLRRNVL